MRHQKLSKRLSLPTKHRRALLANLVKNLFRHERIQTTLLRAKVASRFADRMITLAKRKDLHAERQAARFLTDRGIVKRLFKEIGPRFQARHGGYTRVIRLDRRVGDRAFMALLELVDHTFQPPAQPSKEARKKEKLEEAKAS
ncbi:MAG: 50S ribosomal protein L17 [Chlamydiae bacterium]|nr:50S ribosomal protein L17 [Chlamydiota bacterium]MBI3266308.1 50S ribosomal protein L17 [Chlamydiota bacterium]